MKVVSAIAVVFAVGMSTASFAAMRKVTLSVPGMTCPTCPITIRAALDRVHGVEVVKSNVEKRTVMVRYDDDKTTPAALRKATTNAGYPSAVVHADPVARTEHGH
jgi:mercuric ion binding protein